MGIFGKLIGLGIAAVVGAAVVKVAKKYDENKKAEACAADFVNEEGNTVVEDVKKATKDVYQETSQAVASKVVATAENVGINTEEVATAFTQAGSAAATVGKAVANASAAVATKVKKEVPTVIDGAVAMVSDATEKVKSVIKPKDENLEEFLCSEDETIEKEDAEIDDDVIEVEVVEIVEEEIIEGEAKAEEKTEEVEFDVFEDAEK